MTIAGAESEIRIMSSKAIFSAEPAKGWLPWGALAPLLCIVFVAAPFAGVSSVMQQLQLLDANDNPTGLAGLCAFLLVPFALIGLVLLAWVRVVERRPLASIGLTQSGALKSFLRGHAIGLATALALVAAIWISGGLQARAYGAAFGSPIALMKIGILLLCFAVQSSVEEILFRGWLLSAVARKLNVPTAIVLTSAVFALLHYEPRQHWLITLAILLFSVFACCWAIRAGNVWGVMGWHSGWNWLLAIGFELPVTALDAKLPALLVKLTPSGPDYLTGGAQGPEGSYLCSVLFVGAIAWLAWRFKGVAGPASASKSSA
jgi:membrane protease YdiL (CAAX protease family)